MTPLSPAHSPQGGARERLNTRRALARRGVIWPGVSTAITAGIRVEVESTYRPERSEPALGRHLFSYTVRISNEGDRPARLVSRHWIITDARGSREEVVGEGVVGQKPRVEPGTGFEYSSFCVLPTPHGAMHGSYEMVRDDGETFQVEIAPFTLVAPGALN